MSIYNVLDYGAIGNGTADDTTAIGSAITVASNAGGGVVYLPGGKNYKVTTGNITIPLKVSLVGDGPGATIVTHTANNVLFSASLSGAYDTQQFIKGINIVGNSGGSAVGIRIGDTWGFILDNVTVEDYTGGTAVQLYNNTHWTEGTNINAVRIKNSKVGLAFTRSNSNAWNSFGYTRVLDIGINVPNSGTGIYIGNPGSATQHHYLYNATIKGNMWLGSAAVGMYLSNSVSGEGNVFDIQSEPESGASAYEIIRSNTTGILSYNGDIVDPTGEINKRGSGSGTGFPVHKKIYAVTTPSTAVVPCIYPGGQRFSNISFVDEANTSYVNVTGYDFGSNPVFRVVARGYTADVHGAWDTTNAVSFAVNADSTIVMGGALGYATVGIYDNNNLIYSSGTAYDVDSILAYGRGTSALAYAATVTPDFNTSKIINVGTLTGNVVVANPSGTYSPGQEARLVFTQDGTGGRTVTWGANYRVATVAVGTALNKISIVPLIYNGSLWIQSGGYYGSAFTGL